MSNSNSGNYIQSNNSTRKKGSNQLQTQNQQEQQIYQLPQHLQYSTREEMQQQSLQQQQFQTSQQFKSPAQHYQSASQTYQLQQQQLQQQQQQQYYNNNSSSTINRADIYNSSNSSAIRTPVQTHRQLITTQSTKLSTPRSQDIKGTNINNQQQSQQIQKYINTPLTKTISNGGQSNGFVQNGSVYQMNQTVQIKPYTTTSQSSYRVNTQEGDQSSDLLFLGQYQPQQQSNQNQKANQQTQPVFSQQQSKLNQQQVAVFSPQKYLVQQGQNQNILANSNTEASEQSTQFQSNSWQQQQLNQQQPLQNNFSAQNQEILKTQQGIQQKSQISQSHNQGGGGAGGISFTVGGSQMNPQQQLITPPVQNVTKILKLLDYLMYKNQFEEALDVFWEFTQNVISFSITNNSTLNAFSEHFHERNRLFLYASRFYSYLSQGEINPQTIQGGFQTQNYQISSFSPSQSSQFQTLGSNTSTIYQGNLNFGNPSVHFGSNVMVNGGMSSNGMNMNSNMNSNMNNNNNTSQNNSSYNLQQQFSTSHLMSNNTNSNSNNNQSASKLKSKKLDVSSMMETFQLCMEKIIEENEIYRQQYGIKYPQSTFIVFSQKINYLNNLAVHNMKKHNYALSFEQFGLIDKYSRLSSSSLQKNEYIKQLTIQSSILNNAALASILLEDWNSAESLLSKSIGQQEVRVFPNLKNIEKRYLMEDQQFLTEVSILIFGYVYAELVKRVKLQLKMPTSNPETFYIKNAVSMARQYYGPDHSFSRKILAIQKLLDSSVLCTKQGNAPFSYQGIDDPDLFDSQPLGSSLPGINNTSTTHNNINIPNITGLSSSSTSTLPCIFLILKECQFELNHYQIYQYRKYLKFRKANFDKELSMWKQSMESPNQQNNYQSFNQSSTRISTEPSSYLPIKKNFNFQQNSPPGHVHSSIEQPTQTDRINGNSGGLKKDEKAQNSNGYDIKRSSSHSLQNQNSNRDFSQNGTNAYFLQGHHHQQQRRQPSVTRQKNTNQSGTNVQQNTSQTNNSSHSHLNHRQYYQVNHQGERQVYKSYNDGAKQDQKNPARPNSSNIKKQHNYPTNESLQDPNDQSEPYDDTEEHDDEDEDYHTSIHQRVDENGYSKNKQNKQQYQQTKNPNNNNNNNNNQEDSNPNSKRISTKRVQSEYYMKKPTHHENDDPNHQQESGQIPSEKISNLDDNIKNMIIQVINQNEQIKKEKLNNVQEISQLKQMLNSLIEQQKSSTSQLQQQQQQFIENQILQIQKLEKQRTEPSNKNSNLGVSPSNGNKQDFNYSQPRSPFFSTQSPISPQLPILQLLNILTETPYESFSLSKQIYSGGPTPYVITCTIYKSGQLEIKAESQNQVIATEKIFKDQLKQLLSSLNYQPILPINFSLNMCQNVYLFNKYFILPFAFIDTAQKEIKFLSNAAGLLSKVYEKTFLGEKMVQFFHHIEGNQFRIVLNRKEKGECIKIDMDLDAGSQKKWMEWINENEYSRDEVNTIYDLTKESQFQRNEQIKEMQQRNLNIEAVKKFTPKTNRSSKLKSFKILNEGTLIKELDDILDQIQDLFNTHLVKDVTTLLETPYYLRVKVWSLTQKRQVQLCIDNPNFIPQLRVQPGQINKAQDYSEIKVILKNIYFTFGPGGEKLKAQGVSSYSYQQVYNMYNLRYQNLHLSEKVCILSHLPDYFTLSVHEKNDEALQNAKSTRQSENPIVRNMHVSGAYTRILHKYIPNQNTSSNQEYLYPITFEVIGANQKLLGIRVSIYNSNTGKENGFFLTAEDNFWFFENKILVKNSHHMYLDGLPLSQFFLPHIFEEVVVPLILKYLTIYEDSHKSNELSVRLNKGLITQNSTSIYRIENIVSLNQIVKDCQYILTKNPQ